MIRSRRQDLSRRYVAGPLLRRPSTTEPVAELRRVALPHLQALAARLDETTNLMVVIGDQVRFVATVECTRILRVGDREGRMLPAHLASGGRAVLAEQTDEEVVALYSAPGAAEVDIEPLLRELRRIRRQGFAVNDQDTEAGLTALGRALHDGPVAAAVSVAIPTVRYRRRMLGTWTQLLATTAGRIETDLRAAATR